MASKDDSNLPNTAEDYLTQIDILEKDISDLIKESKQLKKNFNEWVRYSREIRKSGVADVTTDVRSIGVGEQDLRRMKQEYYNLKEKIEDAKAYKQIFVDLLLKDIDRFEISGNHPRRPTLEDGRNYNPRPPSPEFVPESPDYTPPGTPDYTPPGSPDLSASNQNLPTPPGSPIGGKRSRKRKTKRRKHFRRKTKNKRQKKKRIKTRRRKRKSRRQRR